MMTEVDDFDNVVLIVADTLSAFHLPVHGYERETAPFLSELAEENILCEFGYSNSNWTVPSHASLFSGELPNEHLSTSQSFNFASDSFVEDLDKKTIGVSCQHLVSPVCNFDKGFDVFEEISEERIDREATEEVDFLKEDDGTRYATRIVREHLEEADENFFLFMNLTETHRSYNPPVAVRGHFSQESMYKEEIFTHGNIIESSTTKNKSSKLIQQYTDLYDETIMYLDSKIRELYEYITENFENTLFIFTSDHGECIGDYKMFGHQCGIWEKMIRVPIILASPSLNSNDITENVDLAQLGQFMSGDIELEDLGKEKVFAEYKGMYGIWRYNKYGGETKTDYGQRLLENQTKAVIKGREGFCRNTEMENTSFYASKGEMSEQNIDNQHLESLIDEEYETKNMNDYYIFVQ